MEYLNNTLNYGQFAFANMKDEKPKESTSTETSDEQVRPGKPNNPDTPWEDESGETSRRSMSR